MNTTLSPILDAELNPAACGGITTAPFADHDEPATFADVLRGVPPQVFQRGEHIVGAHFLAVQAGAVQARRNLTDGAKAGLGIYGPGEYLFGNVHVVVLRSESIIQAWTREQFDAAVSRHPEGMAVYNAFLGERLAAMTQRVIECAAYKIDQRLGLALLDVAARLGKANDNGGVTLPAITHEVLSHELGTSRELTTSHLGKLRQRKAIYFDRKAITVFPRLVRKFSHLPEVE